MDPLTSHLSLCGYCLIQRSIVHVANAHQFHLLLVLLNGPKMIGGNTTAADECYADFSINDRWFMSDQ